MFVTMSATKSATNTIKSATDATKPATKDGGKANSITAKTKKKFDGNGDKTENITATIKDEVWR